MKKLSSVLMVAVAVLMVCVAVYAQMGPANVKIVNETDTTITYQILRLSPEDSLIVAGGEVGAGESITIRYKITPGEYAFCLNGDPELIFMFEIPADVNIETVTFTINSDMVGGRVSV